MEQVAGDYVAQVSYQGVRMFFPLGSPYDRQLLADHMKACSQRQSEIEVEIGEQRWVLHRRGSGRSHCPDCGGSLATSCATRSRSRHVCVRCAIEDSAAGMSSPPAGQLTS